MGRGACTMGLGARAADSANEIKGLRPPAPRTDAHRSLGGGFDTAELFTNLYTGANRFHN